MVNTQLLWLLLIPAILSVITAFVIPIMDPVWNRKHSSIFGAVLFLMSIGILAGVFFGGKGLRTSDTEVWNGQITKKERIHDEYEQPYQCNCVESCSTTNNNRSCTTTCQTCYETHYTVEWNAHSTLGTFQIDKLDSTSSRVYRSRDPALYTRTQPGEPCAETHKYTNYIKAVPESLFRPSSKDIKLKFAKMLPKYPDHVYELWRIDRVLPVGVNIPNAAEWNYKLADTLKTLGPKKQANAVVLLVNTADSNYMYALQDAWLGAKKNDIVLVIGATKFPEKADWVGVIALTDNEFFKVKLRDDIMALDKITVDDVVRIMNEDISSSFVRKHMKDFSYLEDEIDPPTWLLSLGVGGVLFIYVLTWVLTYRMRDRYVRRRNYRNY